jgi:hypothetical protein
MLFDCAVGVLIRISFQLNSSSIILKVNTANWAYYPFMLYHVETTILSIVVSILSIVVSADITSLCGGYRVI